MPCTTPAVGRFNFLDGGIKVSPPSLFNFGGGGKYWFSMIFCGLNSCLTADCGSKAEASPPLFDITSASLFLFEPKTLKTFEAAAIPLLILLGLFP